jgi:hypothetical protein
LDEIQLCSSHWSFVPVKKSSLDPQEIFCGTGFLAPPTTRTAIRQLSPMGVLLLGPPTVHAPRSAVFSKKMPKRITEGSTEFDDRYTPCYISASQPRRCRYTSISRKRSLKVRSRRLGQVWKSELRCFRTPGFSPQPTTGKASENSAPAITR